MWAASANKYENYVHYVKKHQIVNWFFNLKLFQRLKRCPVEPHFSPCMYNTDSTLQSLLWPISHPCQMFGLTGVQGSEVSMHECTCSCNSAIFCQYVGKPGCRSIGLDGVSMFQKHLSRQHRCGPFQVNKHVLFHLWHDSFVSNVGGGFPNSYQQTAKNLRVKKV